MALNLSRTVRVLGGSIVAAVALWVALRGADARAVWLALRDPHPVWTAAAVISVAATFAAYVLRWRVLCRPVAPNVPWTPLIQGVLIGQMLNVLLPLRLGELARASIVSRGGRIPFASALLTLAIEKLADLTTTALAVACLIAFAPMPGWVIAPGRTLILMGGAALAAIWVLTVRPQIVAGGAAAALRLVPPAWRHGLERQVGAAAGALAVLHRRESVAVWGLSAALIVFAASTNYLLFRAFDLPLAAVAALLLLIALQVGNTVVSVPGNLGVFQYIVVLVLSAYDVDRSAAVAYAIALYVVALMPKLIGGALAAVFVPNLSSAAALSANVPEARA